MTTLGFIGAGHIGGQLAWRAVEHGADELRADVAAARRYRDM
jgi:phosphoglycerate dehydrogenase-like enzyme